MRTRCSTRSSRVMENYRVDFQTIKARYNAAFDAYQLVAKRNAERALGGGEPRPSGDRARKESVRHSARSPSRSLGRTRPYYSVFELAIFLVCA